MSEGGVVKERVKQVKQHYESLLGHTYTWMMGGAPKNWEENQTFFEMKGLVPSEIGISKALDLGCGSGFQTIPLMDLGFQVTAIDMSPELLAELKIYTDERRTSANAASAGEGEGEGNKKSKKREGGSVEIIQGDLLDLPTLLPQGREATYDLAVCMGDTLTHLQSMSQVRSLIKDAAAALIPGGTLVLHFRDLTSHLSGTDRFLPCRSDDNNLFTCVLEYEDPVPGSEDRFVVINDLFYTRAGPGEAWNLKKSQFRKLEVPPREVMEMMKEHGLDASLDCLAFGLIAAIGRKRG